MLTSKAVRTFCAWLVLAVVVLIIFSIGQLKAQTVTINGVACIDQAPCDLNTTVGMITFQRPDVTVVVDSTGNVFDLNYTINAGGQYHISASLAVSNGTVAGSVGGVTGGNGAVIEIGIGGLAFGPYSIPAFHGDGTSAYAGPLVLSVDATVNPNGRSGGDLSAVYTPTQLPPSCTPPLIGTPPDCRQPTPLEPPVPPVVPPVQAAMVPTLNDWGKAFLVLLVTFIGCAYTDWKKP